MTDQFPKRKVLIKRGFILPTEVDKIRGLNPLEFTLRATDNTEEALWGVPLANIDHNLYTDDKSIDDKIYFIMCRHSDLLLPNYSWGLILYAQTQGKFRPVASIAEQNKSIAKRYPAYMGLWHADFKTAEEREEAAEKVIEA